MELPPKTLGEEHALIFFAFSALFGFALALYGLMRKIWDINHMNHITPGGQSILKGETT